MSKYYDERCVFDDKSSATISGTAVAHNPLTLNNIRFMPACFGEQA